MGKLTKKGAAHVQNIFKQKLKELNSSELKRAKELGDGGTPAQHQNADDHNFLRLYLKRLFEILMGEFNLSALEGACLCGDQSWEVYNFACWLLTKET